ncbi:MAG: PaaI family thioesterase [Actinomycetota bacterium]
MEADERLWGAESPEEEERYQEIIRDRVENSPFYMLLGLEVVGLAPGEARIKLKAGDKLHNTGGIVHGGAIAALADASAGVALATLIPRGSRRTVTVEQKVNFMAPVRQGDLTGFGKVVRKGEDIAVSESEVYGEEGNMVAMSMATFMIIKPSKGSAAEGRSE